MPESRQDRELLELLNELRVALPGVQVTFAFLLTIPFSQRFTEVTGPQRTAYFIAFVGAALASVCLIAPSAFHRVEFRQHDKEKLLRISNTLTIVGLVLLAISLTAVVFLITDFIFSAAAATPLTIFVGLCFALLWFALPMWRRAKKNR